MRRGFRRDGMALTGGRACFLKGRPDSADKPIKEAEALIMKNFWILMFFLPAIAACGNGEKKSEPLRDKGKGETEYDPDSLGEIDLQDIRKTAGEAAGLKNCADYESKHSVSISILGPYSPATALQNCMAKIIDKGLAPLCKKERELDELEREYRGNEDAESDIEEMREEVVIAKEEISDLLYSMADAFDEAYADAEDEADSWDTEYESAWERLMAGGSRGSYQGSNRRNSGFC